MQVFATPETDNVRDISIVANYITVITSIVRYPIWHNYTSKLIEGSREIERFVVQIPPKTNILVMIKLPVKSTAK